MKSPDSPSPILPARYHLAENPLWDARDGCLYWTDIELGNVHRLHVAVAHHSVIYEGPAVGGFTLQEDGTLLFFRVTDLAVLQGDGSMKVVHAVTDEGMLRFNDVIADPEGRVFAGTIGRTSTSGGLYRMERDGSMELLFRGTGVSNGMGFSPDLRTFYWTCSTRRRIYAFTYERETGALSGERVLYQATEEEGIPDGLTVDSEGHVWSARWDGFGVVRHHPDGRVLERYRFPVAKVTSLCFGGEGLDECFVTTAGGKQGSSTEDGAVYRWKPGVRGRPEFRSRIGL